MPTTPCDWQVANITILTSDPSYNMFRTEEMTMAADFLHMIARTKDPDLPYNSTQNGNADHFEGPHGSDLLPHLLVIGMMPHHIKL